MFQFAKLDTIFWFSLGIDINFEVILTYVTQFKLASFKLSYVSPENDKIGKMGWWKLGRKSGVWRPKTGFQNFLLDENECFEVDLQFGKVKKMR